MSDWVTVAAVGDITPGDCKIVELEDTPVAIYNLDGKYFAVEDLCSHDGGDLAGGAIEGDQVICPRHGARFCIRTGQALTPPAYEDIHSFPLRITADQIQIRDDRWD